MQFNRLKRRGVHLVRNASLAPADRVRVRHSFLRLSGERGEAYKTRTVSGSPSGSRISPPTAPRPPVDGWCSVWPLTAKTPLSTLERTRVLSRFPREPFQDPDPLASGVNGTIAFGINGSGQIDRRNGPGREPFCSSPHQIRHRYADHRRRCHLPPKPYRDRPTLRKPFQIDGLKGMLLSALA
jgi:hypothetical protein